MNAPTDVAMHREEVYDGVQLNMQQVEWR
ncbi:MAG: hypothetical protein ACLPV8_06495 [Steroidobacteraceae bacterium]